jgi:hypothetical protein
MSAAGERPEPVEPGELREGDDVELTCVYRGEAQLDANGDPYVIVEGLHIYANAAMHASWSRVASRNTGGGE